MMTDGNQIYGGDNFVMYKNIKSLCCTLEINIILYISYTSIKKELIKASFEWNLQLKK